MAKLDIYKPGWIEVVFAGRNKAYGAYELRNENSKTTSRALLIGGLFFILSISGSTIYKAISGFVPDLRDRFTQDVFTLVPPPPIDKTLPPPPPPEAPKPKVEEIRFPPPVVVPADEVKDQEPPTILDLQLAEPTTRTIEGNPEDIKIEVSEVVKVKNLLEEEPVIPSAILQIQPQFPGGNAAWAQFMQGYIYPAMARENNVSGTVYVSFVVEKDGSLTDIQVLRDLNFGTGEEAIRLLKTSPKWTPGIQNGLKVRVAYTQPIKLAIQ